MFFSAFNTVTLYYLFKSRNKQEVFPFYFKTHFLIGLNTGKKDQVGSTGCIHELPLFQQDRCLTTTQGNVTYMIMCRKNKTEYDLELKKAFQNIQKLSAVWGYFQELTMQKGSHSPWLGLACRKYSDCAKHFHFRKVPLSVVLQKPLNSKCDVLQIQMFKTQHSLK